MKRIFKRLSAFLLTAALLATNITGYSAETDELSSQSPALFEDASSVTPKVTEISTMENQNQAGGIIYTKTSTAKDDGTIDITLTAHTTGTVVQTSSVSPTDIVLVLDVSGSMDENYTTSRITDYNPIYGSEYTYWTGFFLFWEEHTGYGLDSTSDTYYVNTGSAEEPVYTLVSYTGRDSNGFEMYEYSAGNNEIVVYPALSETVSAVRQHSSYAVVQLYSANVERQTVKKMTSLQNAVNAFIDSTAQMNAGLEEDQMHTISIVKFVDNSYYNSSLPTVTPGNNKGAGGNSDYNYSQVVIGLTPVNANV